MESFYSLDEKSSQELCDIAEKIDFSGISKRIKSAVDEAYNDVNSVFLNYVESDFNSNITDIALRKARKIVESLLRGENLDRFGLELCQMYNGGLSSYDSEKIRLSLIRDFADKIITAEMHDLREENKRLKDSLEFYKR